MMIPYTPHAAVFSARVSARAGLRSGWAEASPAGMSAAAAASSA